METIEENSKSEMSITTTSSNNVRICLVGEVIKNTDCVEIAQTFGVPVIMSDTGLELIDDQEWQTYFILENFESLTYETLYKNKNKHCILGPPALKGGLTRYSRPVYNFSMRGVVACFKGLREKNVVKKLVHLIHSMGGSIRRSANINITHLICTQPGGDKYQYAKTFRVPVVRPDWVYAAWDHRDELDFHATSNDFTKQHTLKAFEGLKICFFGFPADEHEHMVDVLKSNGGIPGDLNDPECSHVVMPDGYYPETLKLSTTNITISKNSNIDPILGSNENNNDIKVTSPISMFSKDNQIEVDNDFMDTDNVENKSEVDETTENMINNKINVNCTNDNENDNNDYHIDKCLMVDRTFYKNLPAFTNQLHRFHDDENDENNDNHNDDYLNVSPSVKRLHAPLVIDSSTPVTTKIDDSKNLSKICKEHFEEKVDGSSKQSCNMPMKFHLIAESPIDRTNTSRTDMNIESKEIELNFSDLNNLKRRHESFDTCSLMSIDSCILPTSTKKPKLLRTGSITRSLKRSMTFMAEHTPMARMLTRRNTVALDHSSTPHRHDNIDDSLCSINSVETTMNESICAQFKDTVRSFRKRLTRNNSCKNIQNDHHTEQENEFKQQEEEFKEQEEEFKTPKAPFKSIMRRTLSATKRTLSTSNFHLRRQSLDICGQSSFTPIIDEHFTSINKTTTATSTTSDFTTIFTTTISTMNVLSNHQTNQVKLDNYPAISKQDSKCSSQLVFNEETLKSELDPDGHSNTVVDEHTASVKPEAKNLSTHIVKSDWFWYTIQNGYANEMDYLYSDYLDSIANTPNHDRRESLPISLNKRKRKRFSQRLQLEGTQLSSGKRRSSISDAGLLSVSGSFFDCTTSPDKLESVEQDASTCEQKSMRFNHFMDFYNTESNYVGILDTIVNLFQKPLEEMADKNDALISKSDIKAIFGNFLPIHEVHQHMLEKLRALYSKWSEDCLIGDIILQHRDDLIKAYPPYVNFFEKMKGTLVQCDTQNPRFHAFLKINQTKPECGRHSLQDLMIRPVQRLPSISLLLNDILKHTNKANPDYLRLEEALKAIKEVTMHINEDKRKTQSRMAIFDIFNDIENCPPHLVSSNRNFISRCEVNELSDNLSGRGDTLILYLFSDTLEVCKKRSRAFNSTKSPSSTKCYKHINLISLNAIRFVIDITDSSRAFAILCRQDKDELYSFSIVEEIDKVLYLKTLCKQMAENACRTDTDKALLCRTSQELEVDISDVNLSTLSKAFKLAARTRLKVGRAFSFNKTPSKLKRAVSTMMTSPFGSTNSLTPASQLAQMRLASCTNIHEVTQEENCNGIQNKSPLIELEQQMLPSSIQPTSKCKNSTVNTLGRI